MAIIKFMDQEGRWQSLPATGPKGFDGKSAYQLAVETGYEGTIEEWVASIKGEPGSAHVNLLDNWDFRNPVNQRRIVSGSALSASGYWLDRWQYGIQSIAWTQGTGVSMAVGAAIWQYLERPYASLLGKPVTVSLMMADGTMKTVSGTYPAQVTDQTAETTLTVPGIGSVMLGMEFRSEGTQIGEVPQSYVPYLTVKTNVQVSIAAMKMEFGETSTLASDPPMDYAAESVRCMRYYEPYDPNFAASAYCDNAQYLLFGIWFRVPKRAVPAWETTGVLTNALSLQSNLNLKSTPTSITNQTNQLSRYGAKINAQGPHTAGVHYLLTGYLKGFSADL